MVTVPKSWGLGLFASKLVSPGGGFLKAENTEGEVRNICSESLPAAKGTGGGFPPLFFWVMVICKKDDCYILMV